MVTPYKLSRELHGHSQDVRAITFLSDGHIATGSRDNTVKIWDPLDPSKSRTLTAHQNFVSSLLSLSPSSDNPSRVLASGGHDKVICVWDSSITNINNSNNNNNNNNNNDNSNSNDNNNNSDDKDMEKEEVLNYMLGHENAVPALSTTVEGDIISGSWDKTARIWKLGQVVQELKGHEHAVWAVLGLPNGDVVTASADSSIKIWTGPLGKMVCKKTLKQHKDCVRGLALVPGVGFVSCSNDETLILWSMDGEPLQTLYGHTAFVYTVAVLSLSPSDYLIISGSEDRTMKIWKDGECAQTITHPSGVWCVAAAQDSHDIASACADGVARTWTQDAVRTADTDAVRAFEATVASASVHKSAIGDLNIDKLPGQEALQQKQGSKDGEHLIVKTATGGAELHSWNMAESKWVKIGDVVESENGPASKQMLYGKEYDYVFDIDVGDGMTLKLGYNSGDNPYLVAQEFLWKEELDQAFLDQVAQFIIKNANVTSMTLGGPTPVSDPFTGGSRYIPGSNPASRAAPAQSDAFTGSNRYVPYTTPTQAAPTPISAATTNASSSPNNFFPQLTMTSYDGGNLAGLVQKLNEFNAVVPSPLTPEEQGHLNALTTTLKDTSRYHASRVTEDQLRVVIKKLLTWPSANLLPVLDLVRLLFTHTHAAELLGAIRTTPSLFEILYNIASDITTPTNSMLALRAIANMFKNSGARKIIEANQSHVMDLLIIAVGSDNKNVVHASATILMNFSVLYRQAPNDSFIARAIAALAKAFSNPNLNGFPDVALRFVIASGTLASIPTAFSQARAQLSSLITPLSSSQDKDLGPAARALAQLLV